MSQRKRVADPSEIRVGVIGYGGAFNMGRKHLEEMKKAGMTPTAVVEIDPERRRAAQDEFPGIETYPDTEAMLEGSDVDLAAIITPHNTHAALALQCLKAGRHVVCEKPLAITTEECDEMIAAAEAAGVVLSTYHNRHWDGCILHAVEQIRGGAIGEVYRIEAHMGGFEKPRDWWRTSRSISGGVLYDWGVHLIEYALQLLDGELVEVSGFAHNGTWAPQTPWKDDTNEDEGLAVARFSSQQWLTLTIGALDHHPKDDRGQLEISGTGGTYLMNQGDWRIVQRDGEGGETIRKGKNPPGEGWKLYQNVADHLVNGEPLVITPEWSRRPIHLLDLAVRSAAEGRARPARYG